MPRDELLVLVGEITESKAVLDVIHRLYSSYKSAFVDEQQRDVRDAVLLADILCNTYTCVETILFRISRVFENHVDTQQWHKELLQKMRIEVPGIRKAVLSQTSYALLDELRRFRHFKRYYYDFEYDWARLDYLKSVYERLFPLIERELDDYAAFLLRCAHDDEEESR